MGKEEQMQQLMALTEMESKDDFLLSDFAAHIEYLITHRTEFFFSLLYRLDVDEHKVRRALEGEDPYEKIVELIVQRQQQRNRTKEQIDVEPIEDWDDPFAK